MYKLTFDEKPEANTYVKWARGKGYMVEGPYKEKLAKTAKKKFDLNGKPKKYAFAVLRQRGAGYEGGYLPGQRRVQITEREVGTSKPSKSAVDSTVAVVEPTITEPSVQPTTSQYKTPAQARATVDARLSWKDWIARNPGGTNEEYVHYYANTDPLTGHTKTPEEKAALWATVTAKLIPQKQLALARANSIVAERTPQLASFLATLKTQFGQGVTLDIQTGKISGLPAGAKLTQAQMWKWQGIAVNLKNALFDQVEIQKELDALAKGERYYPPAKHPTATNPAWEDPSLIIDKIIDKKETRYTQMTAERKLSAFKDVVDAMWHYDAATKKWTTPGSEGTTLVPGQWYSIHFTKNVTIMGLGGKLKAGWYSIKWGDDLVDTDVKYSGSHVSASHSTFVFKAIAGAGAATIGSMVDNPGPNRNAPRFQDWRVINPSGTRVQYNTYIRDQWYKPGYITALQAGGLGVKTPDLE